MPIKEKYKEEITIKQGMEFGMQTHTIEQFQNLYNKYDFDFILLSCHQVNNIEFWMDDFQRRMSQKEYNRMYYKELLDVIKVYKDYSVLAHLDLIVRYDDQGVCPFEYVKDLVTEILKQVIKDGKGIEINTSTKRYGLSDTMPSRRILELYRDLGGKVITIGSDSHKPEHLGTAILDSRKMLMNLGFEYYCTFDEMKPIFHRLDED